MQHLKKFNESDSTKIDSDVIELNNQFISNNDWEKIKDPETIYPDAIYCYEKVIKKGYKSILLLRKIPYSNLITATLFLLDEKEDKKLWLENILNPYIYTYLFRKYDYNKYINFTNRILDKQMIYFDVRDKVLSKDDLEIMVLTELTDNGFNLIETEFGYINSNWKDTELLPEVNNIDIDRNNNIGYLSTFEFSSNFEDVLSDIIFQMEGKLEYFGDFYKIDYITIEYHNNENNLYLFVEVIKNKIKI